MSASIFCQILYPLKLWLKQTPPWKWLIEVKSLCGFLCKDLGAASVLHLLGEKQRSNHSKCVVWCLLYPYSSSWAAAEAKIPRVQVRAAPWKTSFVHPRRVYQSFFSANPLHWVCSGKYFPLVYGLTYFCKTSLQIRASTQGLDSEMESVHVPRTGKFCKCGWNSRCPNCVTQVPHGEPVLAFLCSCCILLVVDGAWMMRFILHSSGTVKLS